MTVARRNLMLGTAGHVDHGKTALVRLLTGCNTDSLAEEQRRGLTIDLGFAPCRLADQRVVGIVDVPGHTDFIRNMVAGAHGIDIVMLVVAADDGVMPQTREHLQILTWMGLRHGLVALTKIDRVDPARRDAVTADIRVLLADTFLAAAPICPVSNVTGEGYDAFFDTLNRVVAGCEDHPSSGLFRLWVEDAFAIRGSGTVVTGIPTQGRVRPGDTLRLLPGGKQAHVRRLQVYGDDADEGRAGECVALNVPELDVASLRRGQVLGDLDLREPVALAEAELSALPTLKTPLPDYAEVHLHVGTASTLARVALLEARSLPAGQRQFVQLRASEALPVVAGERFVIRANLPGAEHGGLTTVGGGRILSTSGMRLRRQKPWTLERLAARRAALDIPSAWAEVGLAEINALVTTAALAQHGLWQTAQAQELAEALVRSGRAVRAAAGAWVHADVARAAARKLVAAVEQHHETHPERLGLTRDELLAASGTAVNLFALALEQAMGSGEVEMRGAVLSRRGWEPRQKDSAQELRDAVAERFRRAGWIPPLTSELAAELQAPPAEVQNAIRTLQEQGLLVRIDAEVVLHRDALTAAQEVVLRLFRQAPSFTTMAFRDALGVSRKHAVPILDHLDRVRWTVRTGHDRSPGAEARRRLEPGGATGNRATPGR